MKVFIKRFWGFDPFDWPTVSFGLRGSIETLLGNSAPGDVIVFAGTQGDETSEPERGRLLGFGEFGRTLVPSRQGLPPASYARQPKDENGEMKWPYSLFMTRAWKFTVNPLPGVVDTLGRQLSRAATSNAVLLDNAQAAAILDLPREEVVGFLRTQAQVDDFELVAKAVGPGGTFGPPPTSRTYSGETDVLQPARTYVFRFGTRNVWKVGWAYDAANRLAELNTHVPSEVLDGQLWTGKNGGMTEKWASSLQAHAMEQRVLNTFPGDRKYGERVHCTREEMEAAWREARKG